MAFTHTYSILISMADALAIRTTGQVTHTVRGRRTVTEREALACVVGIGNTLAAFRAFNCALAIGWWRTRTHLYALSVFNAAHRLAVSRAF